MASANDRSPLEAFCPGSTDLQGYSQEDLNREPFLHSSNVGSESIASSLSTLTRRVAKGIHRRFAGHRRDRARRSDRGSVVALDRQVVNPHRSASTATIGARRGVAVSEGPLHGGAVIDQCPTPVESSVRGDAVRRLVAGSKRGCDSRAALNHCDSLACHGLC